MNFIGDQKMRMHGQTRNLSSKWAVFKTSFIFSIGAMGGVSGLSATVVAGEGDAVLECQHLPVLIQSFLKNHYSIRQLSDSVKKHTVDQFVKGIDPSKTLLLENEAQGLRTSLLRVFDTMRQGDCSLANQSYDLIVKRAEEDEVFVRQLMSDKNFKIDDNTELVLDPDKRGYAKTSEERIALLGKMVQFQLTNYLLTDVKLAEAKKQLVHRYELVTKRIRERRLKGEIPTLLVESFAVALDPHSSYMSPEVLEDFQIQMRLSLDGIGASLSSQDGFTVIEDLIPGGGAEKTKQLRPKDKIISVAQEGQKPVNIMDMDLRDVVKMIRGKKGTRVTLTILRQGEKTETFDVKITRDKIDLQEQAAKLTMEDRKVSTPNGPKTLKIAVIDLPSFYGGGERSGRSSYLDMKRLVLEAKAKKADGMVLDLSRNGGGLLEDAVRISGLFLRKGGVVATKDTNRRTEVLADEDEEVQWSGPLVVLTSHLSASASEILAGALKDYRRAIIVGGAHTFGKGSVQVFSPLPANLGAMKVTTGMFFLPGGQSTQHIGVTSHIQVPSVFNSEEVGERSMDYSLPPQNIQGFLSGDSNAATNSPQRWREIDDGLVRQLAEKSADRVKKDAKFVEVQKELEEAAKNKGPVKLAEIKKKAKKNEAKLGSRKDTKKDREKKMKDLEAPFEQEGVNILVDYLLSQSSAIGMR
jgi:carboxyl-terminal processing protease